MKKICIQYTDAIFYQMYGLYEVQKPILDRCAQKVDVTIINGDGFYTFAKENMPRPFGPIAESESQNAEWIIEFFNRAFARPEFVGWHYCGLIDTP